MEYNYKTSGVCSRGVSFAIEDGIVKNVQFSGGCDGNTKGVAKLCEGRDAKELAKLLSGIKCGFKNTSCPDQLARAIEDALSKQ